MFSLNDKTTTFEKEYQYVYYANCEICNTVPRYIDYLCRLITF